jgi:hypothetical protein
LINHDPSRYILAEGAITMAAQRREKFATRVDSAILSALRTIAQQEGRQLQVLV